VCVYGLQAGSASSFRSLYRASSWAAMLCSLASVRWPRTLFALPGGGGADMRAGTALLEIQVPPPQVSRYASFMFSFLGRGICMSPPPPPPPAPRKLTPGYSLRFHRLDLDPRWMVTCDCRYDHWARRCRLRFVSSPAATILPDSRPANMCFIQRHWNSYPPSSRRRACAIRSGTVSRSELSLASAVRSLRLFGWGHGNGGGEGSRTGGVELNAECSCSRLCVKR